ncbi:MAG: hypothetical protein EA424_24205 [Planctomycetaceae bacterium]|nr:MAG: hypothetical protein EA424_24205 [Planctomycetaceae bacterium]
MTDLDQKQLGKTLWNIANTLRGAMNADDFRDYMLSFLFLRYLSDNYEQAAKKELGADYPDPNSIVNGGTTPLSVWYADNPRDVAAFEKQMRRKVHYVIEPQYLWTNIVHLAKTQDAKPIERYARRVKMKEIEANGFNLNISRYVSTAEAEEQIDLASTHATLVAIDKSIQKATAQHNAFLKQLGLPPLP